jgi:hypothetical protein
MALNAFLDMLNMIDLFGFARKTKDKEFPIVKLLLITTIIGLFAIGSYYLFVYLKTKYSLDYFENNIDEST